MEKGPLHTAFVVFEFLEMGVGGSGYDLGVQLAKLHRCMSTQGYGFHVDNTIGATPQPNTWMETGLNSGTYIGWDTC
jgi:fructosamine-3-kinase